MFALLNKTDSQEKKLIVLAGSAYYIKKLPKNIEWKKYM